MGCGGSQKKEGICRREADQQTHDSLVREVTCLTDRVVRLLLQHQGFPADQTHLQTRSSIASLKEEAPHYVVCKMGSKVVVCFKDADNTGGYHYYADPPSKTIVLQASMP